MNVRTLATALTIALVATACGFNGEVRRATDEPTDEPGVESVGDPVSAEEPCEPRDVLPDGSIRFPDGSISLPGGDVSLPDGSTMHLDRHRQGETLEEYAAEVDLTVLVRATDNAWSRSPSGGMPYQWREFEVVEVLSGSYDHDTLNYGNLVGRTCPDETYLLIVGVLTSSQTGEPQYTDQHFTGPVPPYLLTADGVLQITDPHDAPHLDETLTLSDARARLGDTADQGEETG